MATKSKKPATKTERQPAPPEPNGVLSPHQVHEVLGLYPPIAPPQAPRPRPSYELFYDPGCSVRNLLSVSPTLFSPYLRAWIESQPFTRTTDGCRWHHINLEAVPTGTPFAAQSKKLRPDEGIPSVRLLVVYLLARAVVTGERPRTAFWCWETLAHTRLFVGPFWDTGLEVGHCCETWTTRCLPALLK